MLRERIPMLSAMTLDQLGARTRCDKNSSLRAEPNAYPQTTTSRADGQSSNPVPY
jgi:hypothetical protein